MIYYTILRFKDFTTGGLPRPVAYIWEGFGGSTPSEMYG